MAWSPDDSRIFRSFITDSLSGAVPFALGSDELRAALFGSGVTPDIDATPEDSAFGAGEWITGREVSHDGWASGGIALTGVQWGPEGSGRNVLTADTVVSGELTTLAGVEGDLVYAPGLDNRGVVFHSFQGPQAVSNGTFSIVWSDEGVLNLQM